MKRLKSKMLKWLGVDSQIKQLQNDNIALNNRLKRTERELEATQTTLRATVNVAIDWEANSRVHGRRNWAVVCIDGKETMVAFYDLGFDDITAKEILRYLKQFEYTNRKVDAPWGFNKRYFGEL